MGIVTKGKAAFRKTYPDMRALLTRQYPDFVYGAKDVSSAHLPVPVFCFHAVEPEGFEQHLIYLKENGYRAIDTAEWQEEQEHPTNRSTKKVLLTFDDGDVSLYRTAYPLLQAYEFKAVSFICPGQVPIADAGAPNAADRKLCTWPEIQEMHASGVIDFQSHSYNHDLVFTSDRLVGFLHPGFRSPFFGKSDHAVVVNDGMDISLTNLCNHESQTAAGHWGAPVYRHKPRMAAAQRFVSSSALRETLTGLVRENGGCDFFLQEDWEKRLKAEVAGAKAQGRLITGRDYQGLVATDLERAKRAIEAELPGKKVDCLCPPWFVATEDALQTAEAAGFRAAFLGVEQRATQPAAAGKAMRRVQRLAFKYITRLPGEKRSSLISTILDRSG